MENTKQMNMLYACEYCDIIYDNEMDRNAHEVRGHTNIMRQVSAFRYR